MYYYIYIIKFNTGQFYIGSRQSKVEPEKDTKYWGSPKTYKHLWEDTSLEKTKHIIKVCSSFEKMRDLEVKLIKEAWNKYPNECLNRNAAPVFHPKVFEQREKHFTLKSPTGEIVSGKNIKKFCRENNLHDGNICGLFSGKAKSVKGWTLPETKLISFEASSDKQSKEFVLRSPSGEIVNGKNITKFSKIHGLDKGAISAVILGKAKSHKGWRLPETKFIGNEGAQKSFTLKSPSGEIVRNKNINKFCKENNLSQSAISSVISGRLKSYKGWTLPNTKITGYEAISESLSKEFTLKSPSGEIVKGKNIRKFCKDNNLCDSCIHHVISGKRKSHKGWTSP